MPCLLTWNWLLFRGQGAFSFTWICFPLAKPGTPDDTSFYVTQDTVVVWWHWCSQPFTPSCIQALSPKLCCALLLLVEYSAPFIVSGLCHMYCFSSRMLLHVIQTEAWKTACNIPTCSFVPLLSPWEHVQASPLEEETHGTEASSYPSLRRQIWQPSDMERAQSRSAEPPTSLQLITDTWVGSAGTRKTAQPDPQTHLTVLSHWMLGSFVIQHHCNNSSLDRCICASRDDPGPILTLLMLASSKEGVFE